MRKGNLKERKRKRGFKKVITGAIAVAVAVILGVTMIPQDALAATADIDTSTKYTESLGDDYSTEFAGRVWTDKSVYAENVTLDKQTVSLGTDEDFLVAFSALATAQQLTGISQANVDVVLILDNSMSMSNSVTVNGSYMTRLAAMVNAANGLIEDIVAIENSRLAVVTYEETATTLLELDDYTKSGTTNFLTISSSNNNNNNNNNRPGGNQGGGIITATAVDSNGSVVTGTNNGYVAGTNQQDGIFEGMSILANETDVVGRIPVVIVLTDGVADTSVTQNYWNVPDSYMVHPAANTLTAGSALSTLFTAAYMQALVEDNYSQETKIYSIGVDISADSAANVVMDPANAFNASSSSTVGKTAYAAYLDWINDKDKTSETTILQESVSGGQGGSKDYTWTFHHLPQTGSATTVTDQDIIDNINYVDRYYEVTSAELENTFSAISSIISSLSAEVPTETTTVGANLSGYITYTDPIGEYMEVDSVKAIIYNGTLFELPENGKSIDGNTTIYTFTGTVASGIHEDQSLADIIIQVVEEETTVAGVVEQTLIVKVPASLIPVRVNAVTVEDGSVTQHEENGMLPIRVVYSVSLQDGIYTTATDGTRIVDTNKLSATYIENHTNADGTIDFYSNLYSGNKQTVVHSTGLEEELTVGDTTVTFEPAHTNSFYYIQNDLQIFVDEDLTTPFEANEDGSFDLVDTTTYYYKEVYYHADEIVTKAVARTGYQLERTSLITKTDADGNTYVYRAAGSPRLNKLMVFEGTKTANATETAEEFYLPTFQYKDGSTDPYDGYFKVYLGNNGVLPVAATGNLEISKTVVIPEGLTGPGADYEYSFTINFNGSDTLEGSYYYTVIDADGNKSAQARTIADGGTIKLKADETAVITDLPHGTTYSVTEAEADKNGFTTRVIGESVDTNDEDVVVGTISAGKTDTAEYTNEYAVTSKTIDSKVEFPVSKELTYITWTDETFTFILESRSTTAPMPDGSSAIGTSHYAKEVTITKTDAEKFGFGTITYTKPGVYEYVISEKAPETPLAGISYSGAMYEVIVTVTDDGKGGLNVTVEMKQLTNDDGTDVTDKVVEVATFKNVYDADSASWMPVGTKDYVDNTGVHPIENGDFSFKMEAIDSSAYVTDTQKSSTVEETPMPENATNGVLEVTNVLNQIAYESVTFELKHADATTSFDTAKIYAYKFTEVVPKTQIAGMTYDAKEYVVLVHVYTQDGFVIADAVYPVNDVAFPTGTTPTRVVFFNTYSAEPVQANLKVEKVLTGRSWTENDAFEFVLEAGNDATKEAIEKGDVVFPADLKASVISTSTDYTSAFDAITFNKIGTYVFNITENAGASDIGITYDDHTSVVTVVVTDTVQDGKLEATVTYSDDANNESSIFTNVYEAVPVSVDLYADKTLSGRAIKDSEFFINIEAANGSSAKYTAIPFPASTSNSGNDFYSKTEVFTQLQFTATGTYEYYITESIPTGAENNVLAGVTYDTTKYKYTVVVTDDGKGHLVATPTLIKVDESGNQVGNAISPDDEGKLFVSFENEYTTKPATHIMPTLTKSLVGPKKLEADAFSFKLEAADDITIAAINAGTMVITTTATNAADGTVTFGNGTIEFKEVGTYKFKISEILPSGATAENNYTVNGITYSTNVIEVTIEVTDDGYGNLVSEVVSRTGDLSFTNAYATIGSTRIPVKKEMAGDNWTWGDNDVFEFEIISKDQATIDAIAAGTVVLPTDATIDITKEEQNSTENGDSFDITIKASGTYIFTVHEKVGSVAGMGYDDTARIVTVVATDNGDGTLTVTKPVVSGNATAEGDTEDTTNAVFVNTYDVKHVELSGHYNLRVVKNLTGREWTAEDAFTFQLAAADTKTNTAISEGHVVLPKNTTLTVSTSNKAYAHFGNIIFDADGTYTFVITEKLPDGKYVKDGIAYDQTKYYVQVLVETVNENGTAILEITSVKYATSIDGLSEATDYVNGVLPSDFEISFTNAYTVKEVTKDVQITKTLSNREWKADDVFSFVIEAYGTNTKEAVESGKVVIPETTIKTSDADVTLGTDGVRALTFDDITFKAPGTYYFKIYELVPTGDAFDEDITYDSHVAYVQIVVNDNGLGLLSADEPVIVASTSTDFVNVYAPDPVDVRLIGEKKLTGRELLASDEFEFTIAAVDNAPLPANTTVASDGEGKISFGTIRFTETGTYVYKITEVNSAGPGITTDTSTITATVVVTDDAGELKAIVSYAGMSGTTDVSTTGFTFTNVYTVEESNPVSFTALKKVNPTSGHTYRLEAGKFTFKMIPASGNPSSDPISSEINATNDAYGNVTFTTDASYAEPGVYTYTIGEVRGVEPGIDYDNSVYTVTVTVTDNPVTAKLNTNVVITLNDKVVDSIHFNNGYNPNSATIYFYGDKVLAGQKALEAGEFTFKLDALGYYDGEKFVESTNIPMPTSGKYTTTNLASGHYHFDTITYNAEGKYEYAISEVDDGKVGYTYDDKVYRLRVEVEHAQDTGEYVATVKHLDGDVVFNNDYTPIATGITFEGTKELTGRSLNAGEFEFTLYDGDGKEVETVSNAADKTFEFKKVEFTKAGEYCFSIVEKVTNLVGVTYDLSTYDVTVVVEDKAGQLTVTDTEYVKGNEEVETIIFSNSYEAVNPATIQFAADKTLTGRELSEGEFTFLLTGTDGTKMSATNGADGSILFDEIEYKEEGTYEYQITEWKGNDADIDYDKAVYTVTVKVTDDFKGNFAAEITGMTVTEDGKTVDVESITFENVYDAPDPNESPKTGDMNTAILYGLLIVAVVCGASAVVVRRRA